VTLPGTNASGRNQRHKPGHRGQTGPAQHFAGNVEPLFPAPLIVEGDSSPGKEIVQSPVEIACCTELDTLGDGGVSFGKAVHLALTGAQIGIGQRRYILVAMLEGQ